MPWLVEPLSALTPTEVNHLRTIVEELSRPEARDPKLAAVTYFLWHRHELTVLVLQPRILTITIAAELADLVRRVLAV